MASVLFDYPAVRDYLYSLKHHGAKYGIDRMRLLSAYLNHPERSFPIVHVAGTNGKGSVCAMVESIVRHSGYKTGLYTSPHLIRQGERIQINRKILDESLIVAYTRELSEAAAALAAVDRDDHPSFFEFMTAMAFLHFQRSKVDLGVIETGLGGRLDATNVVEPEITAITSISFDHMAQLGNTLAAIAGEKAGILKAGKPVVIGHLPPEAEAVVRDRANLLNCPVISIREKWGEDLQNYPETNLKGSYQRINAAIAWEITDLLRPRFPLLSDSRPGALQSVDWAGRWQEMKVDGRRLILDASHNPEGSQALRENLASLVLEENGKKPVILVGTLGLDRAAALMPVVADFAREIHLLSPAQSRACSADELRSCLPETFSGLVRPAAIKDLFPRQQTCLAGKPGDTIVVTGSIYLLGEVLEAITADRPVGQSVLQDIP